MAQQQAGIQAQRQALPRLWVKLTVPQGNLVQGAGMVVGAALLVVAAGWHGAAPLRVFIMLLGWFSIYCCCHALGHYAIGRLVGIRFRGFGLRGTDHPEAYPPGVRQLMSIMPFFTALTDKESMQRAAKTAKALMFAAGETATTVCAVLAAGYALSRDIPGSNVLWVFTLVLVISSTFVTAIIPRGDYAKAIKALWAAR
jgi:hypothetical protein